MKALNTTSHQLLECSANTELMNKTDKKIWKTITGDQLYGHNTNNSITIAATKSRTKLTSTQTSMGSKNSPQAQNGIKTNSLVSNRKTTEHLVELYELQKANDTNMADREMIENTIKKTLWELTADVKRIAKEAKQNAAKATSMAYELIANIRAESLTVLGKRNTGSMYTVQKDIKKDNIIAILGNEDKDTHDPPSLRQASDKQNNPLRDIRPWYGLVTQVNPTVVQWLNKCINQVITGSRTNYMIPSN